MSKVAVVTDSSAYLPPDLLEKYNITVTPQVLIWGDETFLDGIDILPDEFYKRLATSKVMPTTSQVAFVTMKAAFEKLLTEGYYILGIFISAKLSGTIQSATRAREMLTKLRSWTPILQPWRWDFMSWPLPALPRRGLILLSARNWRKNTGSTLAFTSSWKPWNFCIVADGLAAHRP